jgi:hypothetical protein
MAPSKHQLEFQYRVLRLRLIQKLGLYGTIIAVAALGFHCLYLCVHDLAGKQTTASFLLSLYSVLKAPRAVAIAVAYLLTGLASSWGYGERRAKKRAIDRLHPMARQAQAMLDAHKGSSGITLSGDTGPEDDD